MNTSSRESDHDGYKMMNIMICISDLYLTPFHCRCDAGDSSGADKFHKKAAELREPYKPLFTAIVKKTLGNDNRMSNDVLDNLLQRSNILIELTEWTQFKSNDRAGKMSAQYNLLTYLGNARLYILSITHIFYIL